jgi:tetratricopeptide (TPR) repeat protein
VWKPLAKRIALKANRQRKRRTSAAVASDPSTAPAGVAATWKRRWLFPPIALVALPILLLAGIEFALRAAGYGYPTAFFLPWTVGGKKVFVGNEKFGWRFFPRQLARRPLPVTVNEEKLPGTFRIFVFGESAAMGDPEPAFGFSRVLEVLLRERFPGARFDVINVAFTAINSHVILPLARECARHQGDLWIVYMGNNEVMGPFGAGTVFSAQSPPLPVIRASLALKRLKLGQWTDQTMDRFFAPALRTQSWAGMEMFLDQQIRRDDPRLHRVYDHFRTNLEDIIQAGVRSGAKVVVSTVASNLRDCAPLASLHAADLSESQISEWDGLYREANALTRSGQVTKAIDRYLVAERIDGTHAELQFRLGHTYQTLTNRGEARRRFELARDLDTLRFRADSRINSLIKEVTVRREEGGVYWLDATEALAQESAEGLPGAEFFFDHVHLTFEGNYRLARALAETTLHVLPAEISRNDKGSWASSERCARRLAWTDWSVYAMYETMLRRLSSAPFTNQFNHAARRDTFLAKLAALRSGAEASALRAASAVFTEALSNSPQDPMLREHFAKLLHARGDFDGALAEFRRVIELWPHYAAGYYNAGSVLRAQGKATEAAQFFHQALRANPDYAEAHYGLGLLAMSEGGISEATRSFSKAIQLRPGLWEAHLNLALALEKQGDPVRAVSSYAETLRLNPNSDLAHLRLGDLLARQGDLMTAMQHFSDAARAQPHTVLTEFNRLVQTNPQDALAHFKLANALAALGRAKEAMESLRQAVRLKSDFWEARYFLGVELATQERLPEAQAQFAEAVRLRPDFALAHLNLGVALAKQARLGEAAVHFHETLRLQPTNRQAQHFLQTLKSITNAVPSR